VCNSGLYPPGGLLPCTSGWVIPAPVYLGVCYSCSRSYLGVYFLLPFIPRVYLRLFMTVVYLRLFMTVVYLRLLFPLLSLILSRNDQQTRYREYPCTRVLSFIHSRFTVGDTFFRSSCSTAGQLVSLPAHIQGGTATNGNIPDSHHLRTSTLINVHTLNTPGYTGARNTSQHLRINLNPRGFLGIMAHNPATESTFVQGVSLL